MLVVGGLGGGGDVGLSVIIVEDQGLATRVSAIASFADCLPGGPRGVGRRIAGALVEVAPGGGLGRRAFEDKLYPLVPWARRTYIFCTRSPWGELEEAMEWLVGQHAPKCLLHTDIGGDGLVLGYESKLGSYHTDAVARALLAWSQEQLGVKSLIGVGALGAEGGGRDLDLVELLTTLVYLDKKRAIGGVLRPIGGGKGITLAWKLLEKAESGMLPTYLNALEGRKEAVIHQAYLRGKVTLRPWYPYIVLLDASKSCALSPLCKATKKRGLMAIKRWKPPAPPREWSSIHREISSMLRREGTVFLDSYITRLLDNRMKKGGTRILRLCNP